MDDESDILSYRDGIAEHTHVRSTLLHERRSGRTVLVTIAIPTFRRLWLLKQALASAAAQQTLVPFEIIVVDNDHESQGSETIEYLDRLEATDFRYFRNDQNIGMFGNWNRCLTLAEGEWITILNDDDLLHPYFLAECLSVANINSSVHLVSTGSDVLDERAHSSKNFRWFMRKLNPAQFKPKKIRRLNLIDYFLSSPHHGSLGILMRTTKALELGGYSPSLFPSADLVFFVRYQQRFGSHYYSRALATYRIAVNESLRPTVVEGWVRQGLRLRAQLMRQIPLPERLLSLYSRLMAAEVVLICRDYFSIEFPSKDLMNKYNLPGGPVYLGFRLLRIIIRAADFAQTAFTPNSTRNRSL